MLDLRVVLPIHGQSQIGSVMELTARIKTDIKGLSLSLSEVLPNSISILETGFSQSSWTPKDSNPYIWILVETDIPLPIDLGVEEMAGTWKSRVTERDQETIANLMDNTIFKFVRGETTGFSINLDRMKVEARGTDYTYGKSVLRGRVTLPLVSPYSIAK